jgi:hypothetical protein
MQRTQTDRSLRRTNDESAYPLEFPIACKPVGLTLADEMLGSNIEDTLMTWRRTMA